MVGAFVRNVRGQIGGASGGGATPLLCVGGAGTGKSALIHEILARSAPYGRVVVTGVAVCADVFLGRDHSLRVVLRRPARVVAFACAQVFRTI
eukprot:COSAG01_NODE_7648_length_3115_cov_1.548077_1_plen_93_part_00